MPDDKTTLKRLIITTVKDAKAPTPHARRLAEAKTAIAADEARLKLTGAKRLRFLATFRLKDVTSPMKGAYAERREHLTLACAPVWCETQRNTASAATRRPSPVRRSTKCPTSLASSLCSLP